MTLADDSARNAYSIGSSEQKGCSVGAVRPEVALRRHNSQSSLLELAEEGDATGAVLRSGSKKKKKTVRLPPMRPTDETHRQDQEKGQQDNLRAIYFSSSRVATDSPSSTPRSTARSTPASVASNRSRRLSLTWLEEKTTVPCRGENDFGSFMTIHSYGNEDAELRAIPAWKALSFFGWMFRSNDKMFHFSEVVPHIEDFWSYSRHSNCCDITSMLLLHYNGLPALVCGCLASLALPSLLPRQLICLEHDAKTIFSMTMGVLVTLLVAIMWPTRRRVFLDKVCIPQDDDAEKRQGILNLGCFIENSKQMIVLWEDTYFTRLWCVFEIAAYLKLQADGVGSNKLHVLPVSYGRMTALCFLGDAFYILFSYWFLPKFVHLPAFMKEEFSLFAMVFVFVILGVYLDKHVSAFANRSRQLQNFAIQEANCFCCGCGHFNPENGQRINCDRELIQCAVEEWFDNLASFNYFVRTELQRHITLKANLPYRYALMAFLPHLLYGLAKCGEKITRGKGAWTMFVQTLAKLFILGPSKWSLCFAIFSAQKKKVKAGQTERHLTLSGILLLTLGMSCVRRLWHYLAGKPNGVVLQMLIYGPFLLKSYWGHI